MSTEFNELLIFFRDRRPQIWVFGTREEVIHIMNELCVKQVARDRAQFLPVMPVVAVPGTFMTILER